MEAMNRATENMNFHVSFHVQRSYKMSSTVDLYCAYKSVYMLHIKVAYILLEQKMIFG